MVGWIGIVTASTIVAELGDIRKYESSSQIIKMVGLSLIEASLRKK
ncbi:MAG: transposase [Bacillota bacterium]|nr:transposase [Bacillota bacterium]